MLLPGFSAFCQLTLSSNPSTTCLGQAALHSKAKKKRVAAVPWVAKWAQLLVNG